MGKKKDYDLFEGVMETGKVGVGAVGVTGLTAHLSGHVPGGHGNQILSSMSTLRILPTMKATEVTFGSLRNLERKAKKK